MSKIHGKRYAYKFDFQALLIIQQSNNISCLSSPLPRGRNPLQIQRCTHSMNYPHLYLNQEENNGNPSLDTQAAAAAAAYAAYAATTSYYAKFNCSYFISPHRVDPKCCQRSSNCRAQEAIQSTVGNTNAITLNEDQHVICSVPSPFSGNLHQTNFASNNYCYCGNWPSSNRGHGL